ncbi:MAG: hypothetical protein ABI479_08075 [Gallionella sp.]
MKNEKNKSAKLSDFNSSRRTLLRNALVAGCALCVPITWAAETSPDKAQQPVAEEGKKVSKAQAKYQGKPNNKKHCAVCNNFIAPNACKRVEGKISPNGWCTLFTPKTA